MSGTVIVGSGGGHKAVRFLVDNFDTFTADQQAKAVDLLRPFVQGVNEHFNKDFDTENL